MRARIYEAMPGLLYDVELEDGRTFSWVTREELPALVRNLRLEPWPEEPAESGGMDTSGAWMVEIEP